MTLQERISELATAIGAELHAIRAILAGMPGGGGNEDITTEYSIDATQTGTTPKRVASIKLAAGTYRPATAYLQTLNRYGYAILELRANSGALVCQITATSFNGAWYASTQGFSLANKTDIQVTLRGTLFVSRVTCKGLSLSRINTGTPS